MKSFVKYGLTFVLAFSVAGLAGYFSISLFTASAEKVVLPALTGKNIIYVLETLTNLGLNAKLRETQYHDTIPQYGVTFQDPAAGSFIKKGRDVIITLSRGKPRAPMPDLRQVSLKQARLVLERRELPVRSISHTYSADTIKDRIIAQYPLPHTSVARDTGCRLLVSKGPEPTARMMPDVAGLPLTHAVTRLAGLQLAASAVRSAYSPAARPGQVLSQDPPFGHAVYAHEPILLEVNDTREDLKMPPGSLQGLVLVSHTLEHGYLKKHVRVETDLLGMPMDYINEYMAPGSDINILIPAGIKTIVAIFVDEELVRFETIDPWN